MDDIDRVRISLGIRQMTCDGCRHTSNGGCELFLRGLMEMGGCTNFHRRYYDIPMDEFMKETR